MSNIFSSKETIKGGNIDEDFIGGGGVFETDVYLAEIKTAYLSKSNSSEAVAINFIMNVDNKELRSQIWTTNGKGDTTYKDKKTGESKHLPGFNQLSALCLLACGKDVKDMDVEELTVKIYDFDAKRELPKAVDCFTELHGEKVHIAVQKQIVDKNEKNESTGKYEPTGKTRTINEIVKFFAEDKLVTISEVAKFVESLGGDMDEIISDGDVHKAIKKMEEEQGNYHDKWLKTNKGETYDKSTGSKSEGTSFNKQESTKDTSAKNALFD